MGNNNETYNNSLAKEKCLVDHLNIEMKDTYVPEDCLSLDESLMLRRGRLIFRQYIKNKNRKYGIKFFELCQYDGVILQVSV